jgi:uncharacterized protein YaaN involved in tellurite resistance
MNMDNLEKCRQKIQEQVDKWIAELERLRMKAEVEGAETIKNLPEYIKTLEIKIEEGSAKLKELAEINEEAWEPLREGIESAWKSLAEGFTEAAEKFKWEKEKE